MNASFPVISPAVSLPTDPPRRPVDAGYFDNYGVDVVAQWMTHNREHIIRYTGGVALVQIRAFPLQQQGHEFARSDSENGESAGILSDAVAVVSTPLRALLRARGNVAYHRNNEMLAALDRSFNHLHRPNFFTTVAFELNTDAALNWFISSEDKADIARQFGSDSSQGATLRRQVAALLKWFGRGGR
jgi:hypothetical protein